MEVGVRVFKSGIDSKEQITQQIHLVSAVFEMVRIFANLLLQLIFKHNTLDSPG